MTETTPQKLYPECIPFSQGFLERNGHSIYYEQCGAPDGIPTLFIHGGPGSGCNENSRRYFDPKHYRSILFDQRGCHRSTFTDQLKNNSTAHLLDDMEGIRESLGINRWMLLGGSWGATLALLYAQRWPERVSGMILRGSFLARKQDLDWFISSQIQAIFPDHWARFMEFFHPEERGKLAETLHACILDDGSERQKQAAIAWSQWAGTVVTHALGVDYEVNLEELPQLIASTRIEMHYAINRYFIEDDQILSNINRLPQVPVHIIHGRHDLTCVPASSWLLHQAIPGSSAEFLHQTGHLASEPRMLDALIRASDSMVHKLSGS
ncbi:MAG: prolyl aminopeptidase [Candidatus Eutrophobiaceae bacterium]